MKKHTLIFSFLLAALVFVSCKKEQSLQGYLVENQDKQGFIAADVPASLLRISASAAASSKDIEAKKALESIKKINVVALPIKGNEEKFEAEKKKLKDIFSNSKKYKSLFSVKDKRGNMNLYYLGEADNIDEIVAFGYSNKMGLGIARLLGDNMNPSKIMEAMQDLDLDPNSEQLTELVRIFDGNETFKLDSNTEIKLQE